MPDVYNTIVEAAPDMVATYLAEIEFPFKAHVVEVGCGTGPVSRRLANWPNVGKVVGIDPLTVFLDKARELGNHLSHLPPHKFFPFFTA